MIKSEEVRKQLIEMLPRRYSNAPSNMRKFKAHDEVIKYVRQQEKVNKLLELYRKIFKNFWSDNFTMGEYKLVENKIKKLESELND